MLDCSGERVQEGSAAGVLGCQQAAVQGGPQAGVFAGSQKALQAGNISLNGWLPRNLFILDLYITFLTFLIAIGFLRPLISGKSGFNLLPNVT